MTGLMREAAERDPDEIALTDLDTEYRWSELADLCERAARALGSLDLGSGRVGIVARNSASTALVYAAARYAGVSLVPMSFHLTAPEIEYIVRDAGVDAVFCDEDSVGAVSEAADAVGVPHVVSWPSASGRAVELHAWIGRFPSGALDLSLPAVPNVLYTSGTTGFPKGVRLPKGAMGSVDEFVTTYREPAGAGPFLTVGPLYHAGPLGSIRRLTGGRPLVVLRHFDPERVLEVIERWRVTGVTLVPTHFVRLLALPGDVRSRYDVSSLRMVDHTGSACPPEVKRQMIDWFGPVLEERYGATESGTICTIGSAEWLGHPGSVGRTRAGFTALVVDDDGNELPSGAVGRLFFVDHTGKGIVYENAAAKTAEAHLRPGTFTLGDLGYVDEDGYVYITGRNADTVISGGVNLYPAEIERVLLEHPGIADAAVVGVPSRAMGEALKALVVAGHPALTVADVMEHCAGQLAGPKRPRIVELVDELPRNPMGKLLRGELRARHASPES